MNQNGVKVYKSIFVILVLLIISERGFSEESFFGSSDRKSKEDYKNSKCINVSTQYREKLTYKEVCKYGESCPYKQSKDKYTMYCVLPNLSQCFENKSWKSANQLVGVPEKVKIGLVTQGLSLKKGAKTGKTCAYYN